VKSVELYQQRVVNTKELFASLDFDTDAHLSVKAPLFMENVDFRNRQRLKVSF